MCSWGDVTELTVPKPTPEGEVVWTEVQVDRCLVPLLTALNNAGFYTKGSCCGHGKISGGIILHDGTYIVLTTMEKFQRHGNMLAKLLDNSDFLDRFPEHLHCQCDVCIAYQQYQQSNNTTNKNSC